MPAKKLPQIHLMVKTHKYTLALTLYPNQTILDLKQQAISALSQFSTLSEGEEEPGFPMKPELGDFEVMRRQGEGYEMLEEGERAMDVRLMAWDRLFLAWRDERGNLQPVVHEKFSFWGEDEDDQPATQPTSSAPSGTRSTTAAGAGKSNAGAKGKRKAEDDYEPDEDFDVDDA